VSRDDLITNGHYFIGSQDLVTR